MKEGSNSAIMATSDYIEVLDETAIYDEESDSLCTVVLDQSNTMTLIPVISMEDGEEVVMYNIVDDDGIKVEITDDDDNEAVYAAIYTEEEEKPVKPYRARQQGPHICKYCNKTFAQSVNLMTHERVHTGEKPYICRVCGKRFSQLPNLMKHERIHTGIRPYQCMTCKKSFTQQANLTKHTRIHTGERPYACDYCGKRFTQQANLTKHVRLHTGERPFQCSYCCKTFVQQSNLERHERTHTGVKPFQCKICYEKFAQNAHLSKHLRTVHKHVYKPPEVKVEEEVDLFKEDVPTDESELTTDLVIDQLQTIQPKMCIPVLYCTKTHRIIRRVD